MLSEEIRVFFSYSEAF